MLRIGKRENKRKEKLRLIDWTCATLLQPSPPYEESPGYEHGVREHEAQKENGQTGITAVADVDVVDGTDMEQSKIGQW